MAFPVLLSAPAFLLGIIGWLAQRLTSRSFKLIAATFYVSSYIFVGGAIFSLLGLIGAAMPAYVSQALSVLAPSDWIAQTSVVLAAKVLEIVYQVFFRAYRLALS